MASALSLSGCGNSGSAGQSQADSSQPVASQKSDSSDAKGGNESSGDALHLTFYYPVNVGGSAAKLIEQICADFNAENPDIVVEPVYTGNYDDTVTKIQTAMQGGTPPDVFVSLATQRFTMASTGMAMPLDELIAAVGCADLKMSDAGITREELKLYPQKIHEVLGGDITADPLPLSDNDYLEIYEKSYR